MNILMIALGSRGDVLPYVTLAKALKQAGHTPRVATFAFFQEMVASGGVELLPIPGDAEGLLRQAADGMLGAKAPSLANPVDLARTFRALQRSYGQLAHHLPEILSSPLLLDTDLILNQLPAYLFGSDLAEMLSKRTGRSVPWIGLTVIPYLRTNQRPLLGFQSLPERLPVSMRRLYNQFTYRLGEQLGWQMFRGAVNRWRRAHGLAPQNFGGRYEAFFQTPLPAQPDQRPDIICGFSEAVVPRPADWDTHIHLTGWWLPEDLQWYSPNAPLSPERAKVDPALEKFIQSGSPPVFVGLGSMPVPEPAQTAALFMEAARLAGVRLILHSGWAGLSSPPQLAEDVFSISYASYDWLFPQMSLVIHHGGSGTTGYALASGAPSLVLPFAFDQFYWGERTAALGTGPTPIPFARLTPHNLSAAIRQVMESPNFRMAAANLAGRLRAESGVQRAVQIIEQIASSTAKLPAL